MCNARATAASAARATRRTPRLPAGELVLLAIFFIFWRRDPKNLLLAANDGFHGKLSTSRDPNRPTPKSEPVTAPLLRAPSAPTNRIRSVLQAPGSFSKPHRAVARTKFHGAPSFRRFFFRRVPRDDGPFDAAPRARGRPGRAVQPRGPGGAPHYPLQGSLCWGVGTARRARSRSPCRTSSWPRGPTARSGTSATRP